ncbi:MAG TPA: metallophosphoesterase [Acidimicrobiales bacterium]|nr:metallophosphoesterase [Acidimicrobiales bacterium]
MPRLRQLLRRHGAAAAVLTGCLVLGLVAGALGLALQPDVHGPLGPGQVTVDVAVRPSRTALDLPPLGRLVADSHQGPVGIDVRVDRLDLGQVGSLATELTRGSDPAARVRDDIDGDMRPLLRSLAVRSLLTAVAAGVVAGLVLPRRRRRYVAATTVGSVGFVAVAGLLTFTSFSPRAFDEPRFEGSLAVAPDIIGTVQRHIDDVSVVESRLEALSERLVGLYQAVETGGPAFSDVTILHVSDLHSNPVGLELVSQTAERFEVDAIVDTGDLTSFGVTVEQLTVQRVARLDVPYYVVPGNHDHPLIRRALVEAGVEVLDGRVVDIGGIRVLGVGDPTYTADNRLPDDRFDRAIERSAEDVRRWTRSARPDVVAVHNPRQLGESLGELDVGIAGHTHRFDLRYEDGSLVSEVGSAGATGVGALAEAEDLPYEMQLLQFEQGRLVAVDRLSFEGTDGEFRLERLLVDPDRIDGYPDRVRPDPDDGPFSQLLRGDGPR